MENQHLYPVYFVRDASGKHIVSCTDIANARDYARKHHGTIELEPRKDESRLSPERRAEIDAIYAAGVE